MKKLVLTLSLALLLSVSGCGFGLYQLDETKINTPTSTVNQEIVVIIKDAAKNIPAEDKAILAKANLGFSSFLKSAIPTTSFVARNHLEKVKNIYGWQDEKYKDFSDAWEKILSNPKYTNNIDYSIDHPISEIKDNLSMITESVAEGLKD